MTGEEIKAALKVRIEEASTIDSSLCARLKEIDKWISEKRSGLLTAKKALMSFLVELLEDAEVYLYIVSCEGKQKERFLEELHCSEIYWYTVLFPEWLNQSDLKFSIWRSRLMSGEFLQADREILEEIASKIEQSKGTVCQRYISDLSMATDLIVSHRQKKALCFQVTTVSGDNCLTKKDKWEQTLKLWHIDRGVFYSYTPQNSAFLERLVNTALHNSDHLESGRYLPIQYH